MTAVAIKPPSYSPAQFLETTESLEQVLGGASNKNWRWRSKVQELKDNQT